MTPKEKTSVSIHDVARAAGVSIASVSRALNAGTGSVSEKLRAQVMKAVEDLRYSPNHIGRSLRAQKTNTYAFLLSNIQNNLFAAVAWELERLLSARGSGMLLYTTNEDAATQDRCLDDALSRQVAGMFFMCAVESPLLVEAEARARCIFINRRIARPAPISFVGIDDRSAARELMLTCLRRTEAPVLVLHGPLHSDTSRRRRDGFVAAAAEVGRSLPDSDVAEAQLSMESGYQLATSLLQPGRFGAVVCGNDQIAFGVWRRCRELGIAVPGALHLYGFDDNPLNEWLAPWLSTVRVPYAAFANSAALAMTAPNPGTAGEAILPYEIVVRA
jgi:LacI family transcriptional regulator